MSVLSSVFSFVFAFVFLLGVLIFVHELGHFLVAKACGVRVLKFSMGFGSPIRIGRYRLAWKRGHTEYVIAWFPLGGFVKMLGESLDEQDDPALQAHPEETLTHKPLWQKLAIVFAGPAMNLMLPVVVFTIILAIGVPRPTPVIGTVEPGSPAALAGLRPGDAIEEIDGQPLTWWGDFEDLVRTRPGEALRVTYRRGEQTLDTVLQVAERPSFDEFGSRVDVGWIGADHSRLAAALGVPSSDSPAAKAGLRSGDVVEAVGDAPVEDWASFSAAYAAADGPITLQVRRGSGEESESLTLEVPAVGGVAQLGVVPASVLIASVTEDSPAMRGGLRAGDLILAVDGEPVWSFASFAEIVRSSEGRALDLVYAREGQLHNVSIAPHLDSVDLGMGGIKEPRYVVGIMANVQTLIGAVAIDRQPNPLIALPRAAEMTVDITHTFLRGLGKLMTHEVSPKQVAGPIGIAQITAEAFERGWETYLSLMVLISINLGILNLLPIPILDGGQAVIFIIEGVRRSPLSLRTREIFQQVGFTVLVLLMGLAFWNDLSRLAIDLLEWLRNAPGS